MALLKIHDPKKPGDYLWLSENDFDKSKHRLFESEDPPASTSEAASDEAKPKAKRKG